MDFTYTEAQRDLAELTRRIAGDHPPGAPHGTGGFDRELWQALASSGVLDAALPSTVGGGGFGVLEQCAIGHELGRAVAAVPYVPAIAPAGSVLAEFGGGELLERWVVPAVRGQAVVSAAVPDDGTPTGFALDAEGGLSGEAQAVPYGAYADGLLVQATATGGDVLALVAADASGLDVEPQRVVDHADAALVRARGVRPQAVLPAESVPFLRRRLTLGGCARQLGVVERALELTADYAGQRHQFGTPIGGFQAVRHRLADGYVDVDAVRLTLWQAAWRLASADGETSDDRTGDGGVDTRDTDVDVAIATAKYWAAEAGHRVAHTAVHVHGGVGIDVEHDVHRYFVAAKRNEFAGGGATAQLNRLGELLA
ncbi:alkylation response protein AidB-like acyl-CoA dehydrogenase [Prauserella sediminis]|uniref:Alkylation response protein AidB-like acyl-CoA dehydrogenase n=1 Tax=Prauserella sediminis TaxID=577680 RepID=A0A839XNN2_9PSEU|nr:acyl-CoA dehydrogenase family protein [Prauserella sediminis]MBB3664351.1 alkylation response protein AidB-like acyl-CoA dehydrogenase [Prauserella sediminis]